MFYYKNISGQSVCLRMFRTSSPLVSYNSKPILLSLKPNELFNDSDWLVSDIKDVSYNQDIIDTYVSNNILAKIEVPYIVTLTVNFTSGGWSENLYTSNYTITATNQSILSSIDWDYGYSFGITDAVSNISLSTSENISSSYFDSGTNTFTLPLILDWTNLSSNYQSEILGEHQIAFIGDLVLKTLTGRDVIVRINYSSETYTVATSFVIELTNAYGNSSGGDQGTSYYEATIHGPDDVIDWTNPSTIVQVYDETTIDNKSTTLQINTSTMISNLSSVWDNYSPDYEHTATLLSAVLYDTLAEQIPAEDITLTGTLTYSFSYPP